MKDGGRGRKEHRRGKDGRENGDNGRGIVDRKRGRKWIETGDVIRE